MIPTTLQSLQKWFLLAPLLAMIWLAYQSEFGWHSCSVVVGADLPLPFISLTLTVQLLCASFCEISRWIRCNLLSKSKNYLKRNLLCISVSIFVLLRIMWDLKPKVQLVFRISDRANGLILLFGVQTNRSSWEALGPKVEIVWLYMS